MSLQDYDIIVLTETWLNGGVYDAEWFDDRYDIYRRDRESSRYSARKDGGGVLIAISRKLKSCRLPHLESSCEDLWVNIETAPRGSKAHNFRICGVYLPPPVTADVMQLFCNSAQGALDRGDHTLILGDFNLSNVFWKIGEQNIGHAQPFPTGNSEVINCFLNFISLNALEQYNYLPNAKSKTLDLALCNTALHNLRRCTCQLVSEDPLHPSFEFSVFLTINSNHLQVKPTRKPDFFKADYDNITMALNSVDWEKEFEGQLTTDKMNDIFYKVLHDVIKQHVPMKTILANKYPQWYSRELIRLLREKNKYRIKINKYKNPLDIVSFDTLRARCSRLMEVCYKNYMVRMEEALAKDPKMFWTFIKNKNKNKSTYPAEMCHENRTASNGHEICNLFAENFAQVYNTSSTVNASNHVDSGLAPSGFCRLEFDAEEIFRSLRDLDERKGAGSDGIPPVFIKRCAKALTVPLKLIFNKSMVDGVFPERWKEALVVPIFKSGEKQQVSNYRPISILNIFGKILEKLVTKSLNAHVKQSITDHQHGFINSRSTCTNLMCYVSAISESLDKRIPVDTIYTDFSKAFDKVDHNILLKKLNKFGIGGSLLKWFHSYLVGRNSKVVINGHHSDTFPATSGVPQGSHLGPVLFNIFINDITVCFKHSSFYLFADDVKIMRPILTDLDAALLQADLDRMADWCRVNRMSLNISKCYCMQFSRNKTVQSHDYTLHQQTLQKLDEVRDLGIVFDKKLKFDRHILNITSKGFKVLGFVLRNSGEFSKASTRIHLYNALVRPLLEYNSTVWNPHYDIYTKRLESVQRRFLYHLCYKDRLAKKIRSYDLRLQHYKMSSLLDRRQVLDLTFLHKLFNGAVDCSELLGKLQISAPSRLPRKCNYNLFYVPGSKTNLGHFAVLPRLCRRYNEVSKRNEVDIACNIARFKKDLYSYVTVPKS